ncbi:hypothetical protein BS78_04G086900 [Paspalum vaginatum]|nr:hypothetical protein BS78_04G086900 [Paspalum vaginatum]
MGPLLACALPMRSAGSYDVARRPLLQQPGGDGEACRGAGRGSFPWLAAAGLIYLTLSSALALLRARASGDPGAFVAGAYLVLVLLFCCLRSYERAEPGSALRRWLKLAVWLLAAALTLLFSYKVAGVMPPAVAALVWAMGTATSAGGFVVLFCLEAPQETAVVDETTMLKHAVFSLSSSPVSDVALDLKLVSSLNARTPIETSRAYGVISP